VSALPIDDGLLDRFRAAGDRIAWRPVATVAPTRGRHRAASPPKMRIAHLHDEEARVQEDGAVRAASVVVDSGPVGALVLVLEIDRRGAPTILTTHQAGRIPGFAQGAIEARWGGRSTVAKPTLPMRDLVELARYALA
jgi:hypothetical protein